MRIGLILFFGRNNSIDELHSLMVGVNKIINWIDNFILVFKLV